MSGAADDDDETRRLREVHSAFRSLPDEEPPERGLAELMAAARVKATEMKPAPWWRVLFRPPMLALATVMVLVGGAVLIGRHGDSMKAESPTAPIRNAATPDTTDLALDKGPAANGSSTTKALDVATDRPADEKEAQPAKSGETVKLREGQGANEAGHGAATTMRPPAQPTGSGGVAPTPTPRPTEHAGRTQAVDHRPIAPPAETPGLAQPPPAPPKIDPGSTATGGSPAGEADQTADGRDGKDKTEATRDDAKKADAKKDAAPSATEATSQRRGGAGPRQPSIDQLVRQCQAAATRGDCAAAKSIAARIAKDDAETYRSRVVKDAAIARCLQ